MYNFNGDVIFTTGYYIESKRCDIKFELVSFELEAGERIIQVSTHDNGCGCATHLNV